MTNPPFLLKHQRLQNLFNPTTFPLDDHSTLKVQYHLDEKNKEKIERKEARLKLAMAFIYSSSKSKFQDKKIFRDLQKTFINNPFCLREVPF